MNHMILQTFIKDRYLKFSAFLLLFVFALLWRLHGLEFESMFMDEIRQVRYYTQPFFKMIEFSSRQQQPPLDYWIGHLVFKISDTDFMARLPAAVFGTLSVLLIFSLLSKYVSVWLAFIVAIVFSLLPFNLYFSQEARPYSIAIFFFLLFVWIIDLINMVKEVKFMHYGMLLLVSTLFLLTRALVPLIVVTTTILFFVSYLILDIYRNGLIKNQVQVRCFSLIVTLAIAGIIYSPVFFQIIQSAGSYANGGASIGFSFFVDGINEFQIFPIWEAYVTQAEPIGHIITILILLLGGYVFFSRKKIPLLLVFSLILLIGSSFLHSFVFHAKTTFPLRPPYAIYLLPLSFICLTLFLDTVIKVAPRQKITLLISQILLLVLLSFTLSSSIDFKSKRTKTDWRGLSAYVKQNYAKGHVLIFKSLVDEGKWEPSNYGFTRYEEEFGKTPWLVVKELEEWVVKIKNFPLKPVVVVFQYRDYYLTNASRYPIMAKPIAYEAIGFKKILDKNQLDIKQFAGLSILSLKESSGNFHLDSMRLFNEILKKVPQNSHFVDMYRIFAMTLALCGEKNYAVIADIVTHLSSQLKLSQELREKVDKIYSEAESRGYSCFEKKKP